MRGVTRIDRRMLLGPVLTGALVLVMWTTPLWSDVPVSDAVTVRVEPQLLGAGSSAAPARAAGYKVDVEVADVTAGHEVTLEVWSDDEWVVEDEGTTDDDGRVRLQSSDGAYGRVVTDVDGSRVTAAVDPVSAGPVLYWSEEFDAEPLGAQWLQIPQPDAGETCTYSDERATSVADGQLALSIEEAPVRMCKRTGQPVRLNGHVILRGSIVHGVTAARIKFPRSRAVTGQFWLQPGDQGARWVMDAEHEGVVVAETTGTDRDPRLDTSVNRVVDGAVESSRRVASRTDAPADGRFHVYSVEWTPQGYTFKIDGETIRSVEADGPLPPMTIGLSVLAPGADLPSTRDERTMYVDWLRVWG
jgi:hypothetical protein